MAEVTCTGRSAEAQGAADRAAGSRRRSRFDAALERAGRDGAAGEGARAGRGEAAAGASPTARRAALARRCEAGAEDDGPAPGPTSPWGAASTGRAPPAEPQAVHGVQALRAAVRALPAAVAAHPMGSLALSFGSALTVDLQVGAQGLELTLRPAPALERAARAELPGLLEALHARGLRVARADIRSRSAGKPGPGAR
jgi:hypothetical protein